MANNSDDIKLKLSLAADQFSGGLRAAIGQFESAMREIAADAEHGGVAVKSSMDKAFTSLNVRPVAEVRAEIARLKAAYDTLKTSGASLEDLARAKAALKARMKALNEEAGVGTGLFGRLSSAAGRLGVSLKEIALAAGGQQLIAANLQYERMSRGLQAIHGDAVKAAADMAFIKDAANRMGLDLQAAGRGYVAIAAAAKGTNLEGQATRDIFEAVAGAMSKLGRSSEDTDRALAAVAQMISKGTVSAEELKGQLGDALPGAMQIAARSVGLTTTQLQKLMESGGALATSFLPRFAAELNKTFGGGSAAATGLEASMNRLKNAWSDTLVQMGNMGVITVVNEAFALLATGITAVAAGFQAFGKSIGAVSYAIANNKLKELPTLLAEIGNESASAVGKVASATKTAEVASMAMGTAIAATGEQVNGAAQAQGRLASQAAAAGATAQASAVSWEQLNAAYGELAKKAADATHLAELAAEARNAEMANVVRMAQIGGVETQMIQAQAEAARVSAETHRALADAKQQEATVARARVIALQNQLDAELASTGKVNQEAVKQIEQLNEVAKSKEEVARQSAALAEAQRIENVAAQIAVQTYGDQSSQLGRLEAEYVAAREAARKLREDERGGLATQAQVKEATEAEAKAAAKYSDAVKDATEKLERKMRLERMKADLTQKSLGIDLQLINNAEIMARLMGDEAAAREANFRAMEQEAMMKAEAAAADAKEAAMLREKADLRQREALRKGELTERIKDEVKELRLAADAKDLDALASQVAAQGMYEQAKATRDADKAMRELIESMRRYDKEGFALNTAGQRVAQEIPYDEMKKLAGNPFDPNHDTWQAMLNAMDRQRADEARKKGVEDQRSADEETVRQAEQDRQSRQEESRRQAEQNAIQAPATPTTPAALPQIPAFYQNERRQEAASAPAAGQTIRLEFALPGGSPVALSADSSADVTRLLEGLRRAGMRVGRVR